MKRPLLLIVVFTCLLFGSTLAQDSKYGWLHKDAWSFGFGGVYPKYISSSLNTGIGQANYGGYLSIQKNFSEHVGLRLKVAYQSIQAGYPGVSDDAEKVKNKVFSGDIDVLYYLIPCEPISPYVGMGLGGLHYDITGNNYPGIKDTNRWDSEINFIAGAEWRLSSIWKLKTEVGYHTVATSRFDGSAGTTNGGLLGAQFDSYMSFDLGFMVYFGMGEKSNICDIYEGLGKVDYNQIEEIVKKYATQPTEVDYARIEDIVKRNSKPAEMVMDSSWVLIGINFDFNKASVRPESIPILYEAATILQKNPSVHVEIQGHTDNIGSDSYNQKLSEKRAQSVKDFLVAKGVSADRLTTVGMGEKMPVTDNNTAEHRFLNRRIEFKVLSK